MTADAIEALACCDSRRPSRNLPLLVAGGLPCPDFLRVKAKAEGLAGPDGWNFDFYAAFLQQLNNAFVRPVFMFVGSVIPD